MQNKIRIGIFDSGMGGTTFFRAIKESLKDAELFYLADSKNCPYGEKSDEELKEIVTKNVEILRAKGTKVIVIACNTATVRCINYLRKKYPDLKFVGTEPAIKLAASTNAKNILVLATPGTVDSERAHQLVAENIKKDQKITLLPCPGLADIIEHTLEFDQDYLPLPLDDIKRSVIRKKLADLFQDVAESPDVVVLGCTHYPLIKKEIGRFFKNARFLDGTDGVTRQVTLLISS